MARGGFHFSDIRLFTQKKKLKEKLHSLNTREDSPKKKSGKSLQVSTKFSSTDWELKKKLLTKTFQQISNKF